jgi:hypothetical protein
LNYRKLHDQITEAVAQGLQYSDNFEAINAMQTSTEVLFAIDEGIGRYMNDPIYNAKVKSLVVRLMDVIRQNIEE